MQNSFLILFGGSSEERLVSVASAQNLSQFLPEAQLWFMAQNGAIHQVSRGELVAHQNPFTVQFAAREAAFAGALEKAVDRMQGHVVILAMHGTEGEDGTIQGLLERHKIAFTGSGSEASRKAFDKNLTKQMARAAHLPLTNDQLIHDPASTDGQAAIRLFAKDNPHFVLKPTANGSSVGLFIIKTATDLDQALEKLKGIKAGAYLAERFITGREITVGVSQIDQQRCRALPCSEVRVIQGRQFDYEGKYLGHGVEELTPAPLDPEQTRQCQDLAIKVHQLMGCEGYTRTDMILTDHGPVLLEINTLPGLSRASFVPQQVTALGENLRDFFLHQVNLAQARNTR